MAAQNTDLLRKKKNVFSTTLNGSITSDATTLACNSLSGVPTDTAVTITIDRVDANGTATPTLREDVTGVVSTNSLTNLLRGEGATTAQAHSNGAVVEITWDAETWNDAVDAFLVGHDQAGAHKALTNQALTTPKITTSINDANGNEVIKTPATGSAVNEITVTNAAANGSPSITATGGDDNVGLTISPKGTGRVSITGQALTNFANLNLSEGQMINGKIVPSVASNNLTVALKGMDGNDPSATNPVYVRIGSVIRSVTGALSVVLNAGTNWFNAGSAELATKEIDYFVYLGFIAANSTVSIGFSRMAHATTYGDLGSTSTAENYYIWSGSGLAGTDNLVNIGRFAATLSAGAGYTWTVPTFTATNLIQRPIYETRWLDWTATLAWTGGGAPSGAGANHYRRYQIVGKNCHARAYSDGYSAGTTVTKLTLTMPIPQLGTLMPCTGVIAANNTTPNTSNGFIVNGGAGNQLFSISCGSNSATMFSMEAYYEI